MRAIWFGRPFLLLSGPRSLQYLKKLGFKTFDAWFDESYDYEPLLFSRCDLIIKELDKICGWSIPQCDKILQEMRPVLEHNKQRLRELGQELPRRIAEIDKILNLKSSKCG